MNKNFPKKASDIKGKTAVAELRRAHYIISILSLALAFLVVVGIYQPLQFDMVLGVALVVLLLIEVAFSLATAFKLKK